jgi:hypothetical protein
MKQQAVLLTNSESSGESENAARLLRFFGVPFRNLNISDFFRSLDPIKENQTRLICSAEIFLLVLDWLAGGASGNPVWRAVFHSALIYGEDDPEVLGKVLQRIGVDDAVCVEKRRRDVETFLVSQEANGFCGPMSGVRIASASKSEDARFVAKNADSEMVCIISSDSGAVFSRIEYEGVPVFLSTSSVIDLDAALPTGIFDIGEHVMSALPIALYVRWAFAGTCWSAAENTACLIIDDPLLRPTHGFLDFQKLLSRMRKHRFSTSIAFIPWNWHRSAPSTIQLFKENPELYSISVHGCDHVPSEFGSLNGGLLYRKSRQAIHRMSAHESRTELPYDRVMVFPQGVFSRTAISALKRTDFVAAINNDTIPVDPQGEEVTIGDFWDLALMKYGGFPIFTRRNPWEGIENFAFDILLGKPALIVIHHDYCRDECQRLIDLIDRVNQLNCSLNWRNLGDVVRRGCRQKQLSPDSMEVEMYGKELVIENRSTTQKRYLIRRREDEPQTISQVRIEHLELPWTASNGCVTFETRLSPGEKKLIRLQYLQPETSGTSEESLSYRAGAMLRRYLCEIRDNYVHTGRHRLSTLFRGAIPNQYSGASSLS